jgi:hypothetical protein
MADDITSLAGPVERIDGKLMLRVPLSEGGAHLVAASRGIGVVAGENLDITIPDWLAEKLGIGDGSTVIIDNSNGKLNIHLDTSA